VTRTSAKQGVVASTIGASSAGRGVLASSPDLACPRQV
jgi:hypothetical protein